MHILHMEDDRTLRSLLHVALTAAEPSVKLQQFIGSDNALEYIEQQIKDIDLFVLDIRVPGELNGLDLAVKIREMGGTGVIIMTSAYSKPPENLLRLNNLEWMSKPWHIMEVPPRMFELIRDRRKNNTTTTTASVDSNSAGNGNHNGRNNLSSKGRINPIKH